MPAVQPARVIHLRIRVAPGKRDGLLDFLREAVPYYEAPGGIRVRLLERLDAPDSFIEVVEYDTIEGFVADQRRVDHDPRMRELLARWRALLAEPPVVEVYEQAGWTPERSVRTPRLTP